MADEVYQSPNAGRATAVAGGGRGGGRRSTAAAAGIKALGGRKRKQVLIGKVSQGDLPRIFGLLYKNLMGERVPSEFCTLFVCETPPH